MNIDNLQFHPLADQLPKPSIEEFEQLVEDIKAHGLLEPIVIYEGKILDGRSRYKAAQKAGYKFDGEKDFKDFDPEDDPVVFVISKNIYRRHLTVGQRSAILYELEKSFGLKRGRGRPKTADAEKIAQLSQLKKSVGVSAASAKRLKQVAKADPALADKVKVGEVTLNEAVSQIQKKPSDDGQAYDAAKVRVMKFCPQIVGVLTRHDVIALSALTDAELKRVTDPWKDLLTPNMYVRHLKITGLKLVEAYVKSGKRAKFREVSR